MSMYDAHVLPIAGKFDLHPHKVRWDVVFRGVPEHFQLRGAAVERGVDSFLSGQVPAARHESRTDTAQVGVFVSAYSVEREIAMLEKRLRVKNAVV